MTTHMPIDTKLVQMKDLKEVATQLGVPTSNSNKDQICARIFSANKGAKLLTTLIEKAKREKAQKLAAKGAKKTLATTIELKNKFQDPASMNLQLVSARVENGETFYTYAKLNGNSFGSKPPATSVVTKKAATASTTASTAPNSKAKAETATPKPSKAAKTATVTKTIDKKKKKASIQVQRSLQKRAQGFPAVCYKPEFQLFS